MKLSFWARIGGLMAGLALGLGPSAAAPPAGAQGGPALQPVIVALRTSVAPGAADSQAAFAEAQTAVRQVLVGANVAGLRSFTHLPYLALRADAATVARLRASPWVAEVYPDLPEPAHLAESTGLIGASTPGTGAWALGYDGAGQTVAVLDTGVDAGHAFLTGQVIAEACFSGGSGAAVSLCPGGAASSTAPGAGAACVDPVAGRGACDHGTHVAGIVAGRAYAGQPGGPFSGVAPGARLIAIQIFSRVDTPATCGGFGLATPCFLTFESDQIAALNHVYGLRNTYTIAAVNLSIGGALFADTAACEASTPGRVAAVNLLRGVGIASVISSGNNGATSQISRPACISTAISVGAVGDGSGGAPVDEVTSFSNGAAFLSLLAPGQWIRSSIPGGAFADYQGTSMAAPHVAGAWAVVRQARPASGVPDVLAALTSTGPLITDPRPGATAGAKPRLQLEAAVAASLPRLQTAGAALAFGEARVDVAYLRTLTVTNLAAATVALTPTLSGGGFGYAGGGAFPGVGGTCPLNLGPNQACQVQLAFTPAAIGPAAGALNLTHLNALGQPVTTTVALSGTGVEICADNLLSNASLERPGLIWGQSDSVGGSALPIVCTTGTCAPGALGPAGPGLGAGWAWFGGFTTPITPTPTVTQALTQVVTLPAGSATLEFLFQISRADAGAGPADVFRASINATPVFTATAAQASQYAAYRLVRVDVSPFATGVSRTLTLSATTTTAAVVNFNVDEVAVCSPGHYGLYLPLLFR